MTDERLPWFHCYPSKLLGALAGLNPDQKLTYLVMLLRIYEVRGPCVDAIGALSTRIGINKRRVSESLDALFKAGKLARDGDGIINPFAVKVLAYGEALHGKRVSAGSKGGSRAAGNRFKNQKPEPSQARAGPNHKDLELDLEEEKKVSKEESESPRAKRARSPAPQRLPEDWTLSMVDLAYAKSKGFEAPAARELGESFRDHHHNKGTLGLKWDAAWRTWVRNELKFAQKRGGRREADRDGDFGFGTIAATLRAKRAGEKV